MKITKGIKRINPKDKNDEKPLILSIKDKRKIIITKNKKKDNSDINADKRYYSYQINIPKDYLMLIQDNGEYMNPEKGNYWMHLLELNKQHYVIKLAPYGVKSLTTLAPIYGNMNNNKPNIQLTLPKKDMPYLQAYDKCQDVISSMNKEIEQENQILKTDKKSFKMPLLYAELYFYQKFNIPYMHFEYELHINIKADIDDEFIEHIKNDITNPGGIPGWLETLIIDWNDPAIHKALGISSELKDYDLHELAGDKPLINIDKLK